MSSKKSGVYAITNIVDGKRYVGSSCNLEDRWRTHRNDLRQGRHFNRILQKAWNEHGEASFLFTIIEYVSPEQLLDREQHQLDLKPEYNLASLATSAFGTRRTAESRRRMSLAAKGKPKSPAWRAAMASRLLDPEFREKLRANLKEISARPEVRARMAKQHAEQRGKKQSPEYCAKLKAVMNSPEVRAKMKAVLTPEVRAKLSAVHKGKTVSEETRMKLRAANVGKKRPNRTLESRKKHSIEAKRRWKNGVYDHLRKAKSHD